MGDVGSVREEEVLFLQIAIGWGTAVMIKGLKLDVPNKAL